VRPFGVHRQGVVRDGLLVSQDHHRSKRVAHRAGTYLAKTPATAMIATRRPNVTGSLGPTSFSPPASRRVAATLAPVRAAPSEQRLPRNPQPGQRPKQRMLGPAATTTYCWPATANVIGPAFMRTFVGNCHSILPVRWSTAAKPPLG
jgi:hypothetical protein